jgi:hypothetical protein
MSKRKRARPIKARFVSKTRSKAGTRKSAAPHYGTRHASLLEGYLKLALVSCPIALHAACSSAERIAFRRRNRRPRQRSCESDC